MPWFDDDVEGHFRSAIQKNSRASPSATTAGRALAFAIEAAPDGAALD